MTASTPMTIAHDGRDPAAVGGTDPFTATTPGGRHAAYARLAAGGPVHRIALPNGMPAWLVTGHDEVRALFTDPRLVKARPGAAGPRAGRDAAMNSDLLHADPPDHTRLRRLVSAALTRRRIEAFAPRVQEIADGLLDGLTGQVDLLPAFAYPLPLAVICELLGVPDGGRNRFREWSATIVAGSLSAPQEWDAASAGMIGYVRELVAAKRTRPADDLLSALVNSRDGTESSASGTSLDTESSAGGTERLSEDELTSMVFLLLVAGHETTVNLIGNGVHALLTHPDQLALLRAEPDRLPAAVEEMLRFDGPVQVATFRWTTAPVEVGATVIPAGEIVVPGLLAAGRDPARVDAPAAFDLTRAPQPHLAFGHGIHHCIGAPLARLEARIALGTLLRRYPALRPAAGPDDLTWRPGVLMHGLAELPVELTETP